MAGDARKTRTAKERKPRQRKFLKVRDRTRERHSIDSFYEVFDHSTSFGLNSEFQSFYIQNSALDGSIGRMLFISSDSTSGLAIKSPALEIK
jgi:hypothetical protein